MVAKTDCKVAIATRSSNKATARLGFFCQNLLKEPSLHTLPYHVHRVSKKPRSDLALDAIRLPTRLERSGKGFESGDRPR